MRAQPLRRIRSNVVPICAAIFIFAGNGVAHAGCNEARAAVEQAIVTNDPAKVRDVWKAVDPEAVCLNARTVERLADAAAMVFVRAAREALVNNQGDLAEMLTAQAGKLFNARPFDLDLIDGELALRRRDFDRAAMIYQLLLSRLKDLPADKGPSADLRELIFQRAVESRQLASTFIPAPRGRDNRLTGVFTRISVEAADGISVSAVPLPIQFDFNQDRMNADGIAAARELCEFLLQVPDRKYALVGHTDDVGSLSYNDELSYRRAISVTRYLVDNRCVTRIPDAAGRGKRDPLKLSDPSFYNRKDDIDRLNRRVELVAR